MLIEVRFLSHLNNFTANAKRLEGQGKRLAMTYFECPNLTKQ